MQQVQQSQREIRHVAALSPYPPLPRRCRRASVWLDGLGFSDSFGHHLFPETWRLQCLTIQIPSIRKPWQDCSKLLVLSWQCSTRGRSTARSSAAISTWPASCAARSSAQPRDHSDRTRARVARAPAGRRTSPSRARVARSGRRCTSSAGATQRCLAIGACCSTDRCRRKRRHGGDSVSASVLTKRCQRADTACPQAHDLSHASGTIGNMREAWWWYTDSGIRVRPSPAAMCPAWSCATSWADSTNKIT